LGRLVNIYLLSSISNFQYQISNVKKSIGNWIFEIGIYLKLYNVGVGMPPFETYGVGVGEGISVGAIISAR